jgi:hypothetical protein
VNNFTKLPPYFDSVFFKNEKSKSYHSEMISYSKKISQPKGIFESALTIKKRKEKSTTLRVDNCDLNGVINGIEPGLFYLLYSCDGGRLADKILYKLLIEAVNHMNQRAFYLVCGNYRRSRTVLDSEYFLSLLEQMECDIADVLSRIYVACAFSEKQQIQAPILIEKAITNEKSFSLIALQQITKIFYGKTAMKFEKPTQFSGMISKLKRICYSQGIILTATCRSSGHESPIPLPEGGSYMRHAANVIIYFREKKKGGISAYLVKHPDKSPVGKIIRNKREKMWGG